jgi:hypothetical protein
MARFPTQNLPVGTTSYLLAGERIFFPLPSAAIIMHWRNLQMAVCNGKPGSSHS